MDKDPKKRSRAFIITFIVVIILLIVGYFLFRSGGVFNTKGTSTTQKSFFPLLGSSKKNVETVEKPAVTPTVTTPAEAPKGNAPLFNPAPSPNGKNPLVSLTANPKIVTNEGDKIKLTWRGENVTSCIPSWTNKKITETSGISNELTLPRTRLFSIACTNGVTTVTATTQVIVVKTPTLDVSLSANPTSRESSGNVTLSWTTNSSATSCTPSWTNKKDAPQGQASITVSESKTFRITCTGSTNTIESADADVIITGFVARNIECSDGIDNDEDNLIDIQDPQCHNDFDATNENTYNPDINKEAPDQITDTSEGDMCSALDEHPLKFTAAEQRKLDILLRRFYILAPSLKSQDDVAAEYAARISYSDLTKEALDLTGQCYAQRYPTTNNAARVAIGATANYTGPQETKSNPYMPGDTSVSDSPSYIVEGNYQEILLTDQQNALIKNQEDVVARWTARIATAELDIVRNIYTRIRDHEQVILDQMHNKASQYLQFRNIERILGVW